LPGSGLALWHIDESQSSNTNPLAYMVGLVQADGKRDLEFNRNAGDNKDLFPGANNVTAVNDTTTPSTRANDGSTTGVALSQISQNNGVVKLKVKV
jgi:immune inhibitor A